MIYRLTILVIFFSSIHSLFSENIVFPPSSGVINVKDAPYNAKGDGVTDDTYAIQQALNAYPNGNRIIYLPNGTYMISDQLNWPIGTGGNEQKRTILQGQSKAGTIIKLIPNSSSYQNPAAPKALIWTGSAPAQRFRNAIRNLTVNVSSGNPGAIGIQFIANNQGCIRDVAIISEDGQGVYGLDMGYTDEIGPLLVKDLYVKGFNTGIRTFWAVNSITFENIELEGQIQYGIHNYQQQIQIRKLKSNGNAIVIYNQIDSPGSVALIDSEIYGTGDANTKPAIRNHKNLYVRNTIVSGYLIAIDNFDKGFECADVPNGFIEEHSSHCFVYESFPTPDRSLFLPIKETPEVAWDVPSTWVSPMDFGADGTGTTDNTAAVQAAINSGAGTVYFSGGKTFRIDGEVLIKGNVKRIIGLEGNLTGSGKFKVVDDSPLDAPVVIFERCRVAFGSTLFIEHASSRTFVVSSSSLVLGVRGTGTGDLFLEDVVMDALKLENPSQSLWARQLNIEVESEAKIQNHGAKVWIFGLKTERGNTVIENQNGGCVEVIGALIYSTSGPKIHPAFVNIESNLSITSLSERNYNDNPYLEWVSETRGGVTNVLSTNDLQRGTFWYTGYTSCVTQLSTFLYYFHVGKTDDCIKIDFNFEEENNNKSIFLEKSCDGINFNHYTKIDSGLTSLNDCNHCKSRSYYRLKICSEKDTSYSQIKSMGFGKEGSVSLFPVPSDDNVKMMIKNFGEDLVVQIFDKTGRQVFFKSYIGQSDFVEEVISTEFLPSSIYLMRVYSLDGLFKKEAKFQVVH